MSVGNISSACIWFANHDEYNNDDGTFYVHEAWIMFILVLKCVYVAWFCCV